MGEAPTTREDFQAREDNPAMKLSRVVACKPYEVPHQTGETILDLRALYGVKVPSLKEALGYEAEPDWAIVGDQAIGLFEGRVDDNIDHIIIKNEQEVREYFAKHPGVATVLWYGVTMYMNSEAFEELMAKYGIQGEDI